MWRPTISRSTSKASASCDPVTGSGVMTSVTATRRVDAGGEHAGAQVAVGEDAGQPVTVHDEERGAPLARS